jgi:hypothetical protein
MYLPNIYDKFVIVTLRHRDMFFGGQAHLWWGPERSGYTAVLETAGLYDIVEAMEISDEDDVPIAIQLLDVDESFFVATSGGFKTLPKLTIVNYENQDVKRLINQQREMFRKLKGE